MQNSKCKLFLPGLSRQGIIGWSLMLSLLLLPAILRAQGNSEELLKQLRETRRDSARIEVLHELGKSYLFSRIVSKEMNDRAIHYFSWARDLADSLGRKSDKYEQMCRLGECYFAVNDFPSGSAQFMAVIHAYQQDKDLKREARTWWRMAIKCSAVVHPENRYSQYLEKATVLYQAAGDFSGVVKVQIEQSDYLLSIGRSDKAEKLLLSTLALARSTGFVALSDIYERLLEVYRNTGKLEQSIYYGLARLQNLKERDFSTEFSDFGIAYIDLGLVYADLGNNDEAIKYFLLCIQASKIAKKWASAVSEIYLASNGLVIAYCKKKDYPKALYYARKVIREYPPSNDGEKGAAAEMMGHYYEGIGELAKAEQQYLVMKKLYARDKDSRFGPYAVKVLTSFYMLNKKYAQAMASISVDSLAVDGTLLPYSHKIDDEYNKYVLDSLKGDYRSALEHFRRFKFLNDSITGSEKGRQISEMQERFRYRENQQAISLLKSNEKLQKNELQRLQLQRKLTVAAVAALLVVLGLAVYGYKTKQKSNLLLKGSQEQIRSKNSELEHALLLKEELILEKDELLEEKDWLVKEIHHRVKNNLQIVMSLLSTQSAFLKDQAALSAITDSRNRVYSIALIHQKLYSGENMTQIDLSRYISDLVAHLKDSCSLPESEISFEISTEQIMIDVSQAVPLGLILNEAITNSIKYGVAKHRANKIEVSLEYTEPDCLQMLVSDNGEGVQDEAAPLSSNSLGMRMMRALARQLKGNFQVRSQNGFSVSIIFPLLNPKQAHDERQDPEEINTGFAG